jgi:hypothetical protein
MKAEREIKKVSPGSVVEFQTYSRTCKIQNSNSQTLSFHSSTTYPMEKKDFIKNKKKGGGKRKWRRKNYIGFPHKSG